jgi:hypothetical protein
MLRPVVWKFIDVSEAVRFSETLLYQIIQGDIIENNIFNNAKFPEIVKETVIAVFPFCSVGYLTIMSIWSQCRVEW